MSGTAGISLEQALITGPARMFNVMAQATTMVTIAELAYRALATITPRPYGTKMGIYTANSPKTRRGHKEMGKQKFYLVLSQYNRF